MPTSKKSNKFYITAAIPYVNAKPHVGHALEFVQGDVLARYHRILGQDVVYLTGADENALKNVQAAEKEQVDVQTFCDRNSEAFQTLFKQLNVSIDMFQRSSSKEHHLSSQELWKRCAAHGDVYKKTYKGLYCVGCETFYTPDELNENGECFEHPGKKLESVDEENYFFKLSKYKNDILALISSGKLKIVPETRKNEVVSFLNGEVQDISISRSVARAKNWGVPVPDDPSQIIYVWFDALNVYQSGVGFGLDEQKYSKWWPADVHLIGKGITRFHAVYWPAMLLSANLPTPKQINVHGYFTVNGQKMSKTLGNVIDPLEVVKEFGVDPLRYYFLREISTTQDGDFSIDRLKEVYTAQLQNGLGNLVSRIAKLAERVDTFTPYIVKAFSPIIASSIEQFQLKEAMDSIWEQINVLEKRITEEKPWEKSDAALKTFLIQAVKDIQQIAFNLQPFLPKTAENIQQHFSGKKITAIAPLFPKLKI